MSNKKQSKSFKNWKIKDRVVGRGEEKKCIIASQCKNASDVYYLPAEDACLYFMVSSSEKGK